MWDLIVSIPDHCLSFYFDTMVPFVYMLKPRSKEKAISILSKRHKIQT